MISQLIQTLTIKTSNEHLSGVQQNNTKKNNNILTSAKQFDTSYEQKKVIF